MADVAALLASLHAMREPPPPAPLAPFLGAGAIGAALAAVLTIGAIRTSRLRASIKRAAMEALAASRALPTVDRLAAQAMLLRRLVRTMRGEQQSRARGTEWLQVLDRLFKTTFFTTGEGRVFANDLYRRQTRCDVDELDRTLGGLLAKVRG